MNRYTSQVWIPCRCPTCGHVQEAAACVFERGRSPACEECGHAMEPIESSPPKWRVGSDGGGARRWHVWRRGPRGQEQLCDGRGRYRRFASQESAQKAADAANKGDQP